jgi:prepilin-type N-terminal cleavage/methylation domain-containing protein
MINKKCILSCKGFTLVELLIVTAILSLIGLTLYSSFSSGIDIWKKINRELFVEDINIYFDKISYDLRNSFKFTGIEFYGTQDKISFPTIIKVRRDEGTEEEIGWVQYSFNRNLKALNRKQANYSEMYLDKSGDEQKIVTDIESLRFQYYYYDPQYKHYAWKNTWQADESVFGIEEKDVLPLAVRIEVKTKDGKDGKKFTKTVSLPASCCLSQAKQ